LREKKKGESLAPEKKKSNPTSGVCCPTFREGSNEGEKRKGEEPAGEGGDLKK